MAVLFSNANSCVISFGATNDILKEDESLSIFAWIYPTSVGCIKSGRIIDRRNNTAARGIFFSLSTTNCLRFQVSGDTNLRVVTADNTIILNTWQSVGVTWDGSTTATNAKVYINGIETTYKTQDNGLVLRDNAADTTRLGGTDTWSNPYDGLISDVSVWANLVLTPLEMLRLSSSKMKFHSLQVQPDSLRRYWPLDDFSDGISISGVNVVMDRSSIQIAGSPLFFTNGANPSGVAEQVLSYQ